MQNEKQNEQTETVTIDGVKQKKFPDGGTKWMLHDTNDRWFQFYETNANGRESLAYEQWQAFAEQAVSHKLPLTLRFVEETKVGQAGEAYVLHKILGFVQE